MNGKTCKNMKEICILRVYLIKLHRILNQLILPQGLRTPRGIIMGGYACLNELCDIRANTPT